MAQRWYTQFFGTLHKKPVMMDCNFVVDPTNGNGYGVRSLKGGGIARVYMHTTASFTGNTHSTFTIDGISGGTGSLLPGMPISGSGIAAGTIITQILSSSSVLISIAASTTVSGDTISYAAPGSPTPSGPSADYIYVTFQDNFNYYYLGTAGFVSPLSGSNISISASGMTVGNPYVIVSVGTSTQANWNAVGLPLGIIPTVGQSFIATVTGGGTGTGIVQAPSVSGLTGIEVVGDPNQTLGANYNGAAIMGGSAGSYMILQCLDGTTPTAPANGTVIGLSFFMSNSVITIQGD